MTNLEKIEKDVESLSPADLASFREWFHAFDAALWDQQLEAEVNSGKLERLRQEAVSEQKGQRTREI